MKRSLALVAAGAFLCAPLTVRSQPFPGYIGVFADAAGTNPCIQVSPGTATTAYVFAHVDDAQELIGAEFRLEFSSTVGYFISLYNPPPTASVTLGDPLDETACDRGEAGIRLFFPECVEGYPIFLGSFLIFNGGGTRVDIAVKRVLPTPSGLECPLIVRCDVPTFTHVCLTLEEGDPDLGGFEPVSTISSINRPDCFEFGGERCPPVAVAPAHWSNLKQMYR